MVAPYHDRGCTIQPQHVVDRGLILTGQREREGKKGRKTFIKKTVRGIASKILRLSDLK